MIFKIYNTNRTLSRSLLDDYPVLSKYGYNPEHEHEVFFGIAGFIVINSLEELITLKKDVEHEIIIDTECDDVPTIEIYDDWRE